MWFTQYFTANCVSNLVHYVVPLRVVPGLATFQAELINIIDRYCIDGYEFYKGKSQTKFLCAIHVKQTIIASCYLVVHWYVVLRVETCSIL